MAEIIPNLPFETYLAIPALSVSKVKQFAKAPALVHTTKEETAAMRMGSLTHCAVLEPGELEKRYVPTDVERRGTKAWATEEEAACGRELVKRPDYDDARRMADAVRAHPIARQLLDGCEAEVSARWADPETGLLCKARADIYNPSAGLLGDIKTTCDASPHHFGRDFAKLKYGWQDVFYRDGFNECGADIQEFFFIAVEKESPYLVMVHYLSPSQIDAVRAVVRRHMADYLDCQTLNDWPGYDNRPNEIILPAWELE